MNFARAKRITVSLFALLALFSAGTAHATVSITTATGGTNISADKAANATSPAYTTLGDIVITSTANNDIPKNQTGVTIVLSAPSGWAFNPGVGTLTAGGTKITANSITVTASTITGNYTRPNSNSSNASLTFSGIQVRATNGATLPASGNILQTGGTGAAISGITLNSTNFGLLSQVAGTATKLAFSTQPGGATYGSTLSPQPVVKSQDQFSSNSATGLGASKTVTLMLSSGTGTLGGTVSLDIGTGVGNGTVTFTNANVGGTNATGAKAVTAAATGLTSAVSSSFTINARAATLTGTRVYDTTTTAAAAILSVSNKVGADDVTVASGSGTLASANAGAEAISSFGTLALGGTTASNYTLSGASGTVTVTKATPTLSVTNSPVTYSGTQQSATVTGSVSGTVSSVLYNGSATVPTNAGTYAITANLTPTDTTNYNSLTAASAGNFVINKATPTLLVTNSPATYNGSAQAAIVTGSVPGSVTSVLYNGLATVPTNAATYAITANFAPTDTTNYNSLTAASAGNFVISKATPTLSVTNSPVTYNGSAQGATVTGSVAGSVSNIKYNGSATTPTNAATYAITADFTPTDTTNYNSLTQASAGNFIINKATPTLSVTNSPVAYDGSAHSATVSGSVPGTVSNILTGGAASQTAAGTYAVTANFAPTDSTNYNSLTAASAGNFVISSTSQTTTFNALANKTYGDADFALSATASSGLTVTFASQTTGVCSVSGTTAHIISVGTCTIRASQAGDSNYSAAPNVDQSFNVTAKALTVSGITANDKVYDGNTSATLNVGSAALVGVVSGDTVNLNTGSAVGTFASANVGTGITVQISGLTISGTSASNYSLAQPTTTATINNPLPTTTSLNPTQIAVGSSGFTLTVNGTNFVASSTIYWNGGSRVTAYASSTQLTAQILTSDLTSAATSSVTVVNSAPGGGTSNAQVFTVFTPADITAPTVTAFAIASTSSSLTVPVTTFTATDNVGVTGYLLTEASTTPALGDSGWASTTPASFVFSSQGSKTLYAWAKDAAGNISTGRNASTVITLSDTAAPTITAFTIPSTSSSLTVSVTAFTATDNIGVTGYLITEASTTPAGNASGWSATAQSSYTFTTQGSKTLYAWAKDTAGNISAGLSANTTITFTEIAPADLSSSVSSAVIIVPNAAATSSTQVTFNQEVHVPLGGGTTVIVPFNTVLSASGASDFTQLSAVTVSANDLPTNYNSLGALRFGLPAIPLSSSQTITVQIAVGASYNGETLTVFKREEGSTTWSSLTTCVVSGGICQFTTSSLTSFSAGRYTAPASTPTPAREAVAPTKVTFTGKAYPGSKIQVFFKSSQDGQYREVPQGTYTVGEDGTFDVSYTGLFGGDYVFGLQAEDKAGNKSGIVQASVNLLSANTLVVRNLFMPPTLNVLRTGVRLGDVVSVSGYAAAESTIEFEIDGKQYPTSVVSGTDGYYKSLISTAQFGTGSHFIRVRQKKNDRTSSPSSNKAFSVSKVFFPQTDLNGDGKIDITDWSIFLSLWSSKDESARKRIDFNGDGKVDLADFSIFMQSLKAAVNKTQ